MSIDVALGTVAGGVLSSTLCKSNLSSYWLLCLGLSGWLVYHCDHLWDAYRSKGQLSTERHVFYQNNFNKLLVLGICVFGLNITCVLLFLPKALILFGLIMGLFILIFYMASSFFSFLFATKESVVAFIYILAIWAPAWMFRQNMHTHEIECAFFVHLAAAWLNTIVFSLYEWEHDQLNQFMSFPVVYGEAFTYIYGVFVCVAGFIFASIGLILGHNIWVFALLIMLLLCQGLLLAKPKFFLTEERYRYLGDGAFMLPLILLCF